MIASPLGPASDDNFAQRAYCLFRMRGGGWTVGRVRVVDRLMEAAEGEGGPRDPAVVRILRAARARSDAHAEFS